MLARAAAAALLVLLQACAVPLSPATAEQAQATDVALAVWEARFGEVPECWATRDLLQWRTLPTVEGAREACGGTDACVLPQFDGDLVIVLFDAPDVAKREELYAAELPHWLERCSGRWPQGDPKHADPEVWPAVEFAIRAELRSLRQ